MYRLSVIFLALGMFSCAQQQPEAPTFSDQDAAAIRTNLDTYMAADPIDDPDTFFSQFTEDVHWIYDDQAPWVGMEGLRNVSWCHTLSAEIIADRVEGSGDLAYARGTYTLSLGCADQDEVNVEGVFLSAHRHQADGTWRIESLLQRNL